jgi:two-component system sensor histidine kinase AtoS
MKSGVISVDRTGEITCINANALRILDLSGTPDGLLGKPVLEVLRDHAYIGQLLLESFKSKHLPNRAEMVIRGPQRDGKNIGFTLSLVHDHAGEILGTAIFFKDLTQIEQVEEGERLKERLAALGQMAAGLAHEIRNPLAGIEVAAGLLKRRLADRPDDVVQVQAILSDVRKLDETVTNCLDFVRPLDLNLASTRVESLLEDALMSVEARWEKEGIQVWRRYGSDLPELMVDPRKIRQVLLNLLLNAAHAIENRQAVREGGTVTVRTGVEPADPDARTLLLRAGRMRLDDLPPEREDYVTLEIADDGCGIDSETLDKIFYPFFTTKEYGSGIGLAVAQKIIDGHRGFIDVESEPGVGTRFIIKLPLHPHR